MAGYGGYFLQGLGGGLQQGLNMGQQIQEMQWKKAEKKRLATVQKQAAEQLTIYQKKVENFAPDGFSDTEWEQLNVLMHTGGIEFQSLVQGTHKAIGEGRKEVSDQNMTYMKEYAEALGERNPEDIKDFFNETKERLQGTEFTKYFDAYDKGKQKQYDAAQEKKVQAETFISYAEAKEATAEFPDAIVKFNAAKGVYYLEGTKPTAPAKPDVWDKKKALQDELLAKGEITREQYIKNLQQLGGGLQPTGDFKTTPLPALQKMEQSMLDAGTWEEAENMLRQWTGAEYNPEDVKIRKEEWTDYQTTKRTKAVENTIKQLEGLLGEKESLRPEELLELPISGKKVTKTKADWYKGLYKQYKKQLEALGKLTDIKQFKELIPPEEIKKVGWNWDIMGDIMKTDWKAIWKD